jgi:hypothetical protein
MDALSYSETSFLTRSTRFNITEEGILQNNIFLLKDDNCSPIEVAVTGLAQWVRIQAGRYGLVSRYRKSLPLFTASTQILGPIQPPIQTVTGVPSSEAERPESEPDNSTLSNTEGKNNGDTSPLPDTPLWCSN